MGEDPRLRAARYQDQVAARASLEDARRAGLFDDEGEPGAAAPPEEGQEATRGRSIEDAPDVGAASTARQAEEERAAFHRNMDAVARTAVEKAMAAGAFDNLAYAGKPLPDLVASTDPDWWTKSLMRREEVHATQGLGPEALLLRVVDQNLDDDLDALGSERQVRETVQSFNRRVIEARRQLLGGPPVVTPTRDVEQEVARWRRRASDRRRAAEEAAARPGASDSTGDSGHEKDRRVRKRLFRRSRTRRS